MIAGRSLQRSQHELTQSMERLATGKRINRASDDPAGLIAVNEFAQDQARLNKKVERLEIEDKRLGAIEGAGRDDVGRLFHKIDGAGCYGVVAAHADGDLPGDLIGPLACGGIGRAGDQA